MLSPFLRPTGEIAETYPHPNPFESYRVVNYAEDDIFAVNPDDLRDRITLSKQDVLVRELDMRKFRHQLALMLGLRECDTPVEPHSRMFSLGTWEQDTGAGFSVRLFMLPDRERFGAMIDRLCVTENEPMIVLTPTRKSWDNEAVELFRKRKSTAAVLEELIEINDAGQWAATEAWRETLLDFLDLQNPPNMVTVPPYEFRKKGEIWHVRLEGKEGFLKDSVGARNMASLFSKPGESVYAVDLQLIGAGHDPQTAPAESGLELGDRQSVREIQERSRTLLAELNQAQRDGNAVLENEIREEIERLADYLCQVKRLGGRLRKGNDNGDSIRRSVQQGIKRTLESLEDDLPEFVKHCRQSISFGFVLRYDPATKIVWEL